MPDKKIYREIMFGVAILVIFTGVNFAEDSRNVSPETKPEDKKSAIPDDTFSPSESVSEDYPVPFPTDI
ncbi:MAG: hypothetical protein VX986_02710 [Pseudomonadota bacterium]|nr:hypothetical protein [Pseudomonadota bacterium]